MGRPAGLSGPTRLVSCSVDSLALDGSMVSRRGLVPSGYVSRSAPVAQLPRMAPGGSVLLAQQGRALKAGETSPRRGREILRKDL